MQITGAEIHIRSAASSDDVAARLRTTLAGGPFVVTRVAHAGGDHHNCRFDLRHPGMAVGYRNIIDLQHRIDHHFDILGVQRRDGDPNAQTNHPLTDD